MGDGATLSQVMGRRRTGHEGETNQWADIYDETTKECYTMGALTLSRKYGVKKSRRIVQEYSNVKRLHRRQLDETEQGALGISWGRHKGEILSVQREMKVRERKHKVSGVTEKRQTAGCGGGEFLIKWDDGEQRQESQYGRVFAEHMRAGYGLEARQQTWGHTWGALLKCTTDTLNVKETEENSAVNTRESYPTLYPGEVIGEGEACKKSGHRGRNMEGLTHRAKTNQCRQERKYEMTHKNKRIRLAKGRKDIRIVSEKPEPRIGGG
eukprot:6211777-Pleurochrysis_carterae.AAC.5